MKLLIGGKVKYKVNSYYSPSSPINIWKKLNGEIFVVNIASVYQMAKKKDSLRKQNHIINNNT